jgi:hypothetical protein
MIEGSVLDPFLVPTDPDPGGPNTSGSPTLLLTDIEEVSICLCFDKRIGRYLAGTSPA